MQPLSSRVSGHAQPVVTSDLWRRAWADACDVVDSAETFARATPARRVRDGVPEEQLRARQRVSDESWERKARELEALLDGCL
jgi:hypothetical protein